MITLQQTNKAKYLGIITNTLSWTEHAETISKVKNIVSYL